MQLRPVILRELRAQARQPFTFWLRVLAVLAVLGAAWIFNADHGAAARAGMRLFALLHLTGHLAIWILVPLATADCISRERREGTLGLLFLTPLQPQQIVIAKGLAHGWRALTLLVAIIPVLTIPFVMGGVSAGQAGASLVINLSAIAWALAAAVLASALTRSAAQAMAWAMCFSGASLVVYAFTVGAVLGANQPSTWNTGYTQPGYDLLLGGAVVLMSGAEWSGLLRMFPAAQIYFAIGFGGGVAVLGLVVAVLVAAGRIRRSWREEPLSARLQQVQKVFCEPVLGVRWLKRWMRFKLERNPIGWLEQRQWRGRLVTWAWLAIVISVFSLALTDRNFFRNSREMPVFIGWLLVGSLVVSAAGSFRRERETGVLELLLVSPLKTTEIVGGRLRGLWGQFFPAVAMFLGVWGYLAAVLPASGGRPWEWIWFFATTFLVTPVVGLYFSARCRHFLMAVLLTLAVLLVLPAGLGMLVDLLAWLTGAMAQPWRWRGLNLAQIGFMQLLMGYGVYRRLVCQLERRTFPLDRAAV